MGSPVVAGAMTPRVEPTDEDRLLFGSGFVIGVMTTLVILAVVLVGLSGWQLDDGGVSLVPVLAMVAAGVAFSGVVGAGLYYLAFPENRARIPVDPGLFGMDDEE